MKKFLALLLALCMALSLSPVFAEETQELKDARSYVNLLYKNKPAATPQDYEVVGSVPGETEVFTVEWTTDADSITVTPLDSGMVKIDVDENSSKELNYLLTATIRDAAGNDISISFERTVPAAINLDVMTEEEIVDAAYALEPGATLPTQTALHGVIVAIPTAYSEKYGNITVNIQVGDKADQPIQCFRLTGEGIESLQEGDEICVAGTIKNYNGSTIEFDAGCTLIPVASCDSARAVLFAYGTLEEGAAMNRQSTATGIVTGIPSAYSDQYKNITVNIAVPGLENYPVQCYRLVGEGVEALAEGDTITVTGTIKNYKGTIEFDQNCALVAVAAGEAEEEIAEEPEEEAEEIEEIEEAAEEEVEEAIDEEEAEEDEEEGVDLDSAISNMLSFLQGEGIDVNVDVDEIKEAAEKAVADAVEALDEEFEDEEADPDAEEEEEGSFPDGVEELVEDAKKSIGDKIADIENELDTTIGEITEGLEDAAENISEAVEETVHQVSERMQNWINTLKKMLDKELAKNPESTTVKTIKALLEKIETLDEDDEDAVKAVYRQIIKLVKP